MDPKYYGLIELLLTALGMGLFGWWQLSSLKRDRAETERRIREESAPPSRPAGHAEGE